IAINLAGSDLLANEFYNTLIVVATHKPEVLRMLTPALTENSIVSHQQPLFSTLQVLTWLVFELALDDYGIGQPSLCILRQLPVNCIKLDKSFLHKVPDDQRQTQLIQSVMQMAKTLKLQLVIEGVETDIQRRFLQRLGAQIMQGYFFAKPMPVEHWLKQLKPAQQKVAVTEA